MLVLAILARLLTPTDFGLLGAGLIVVGVTEVFCFVGVAPALIQRSELSERHLRTAWSLSVGFGFLCSLLVFGSAHVIAGFFRMEGLTEVVRWIAPVFFIHGISLVGRALLQRNLEFKRLAICEFAAFVAYAIVGVLLSAMGLGVMSLVGAYLANAIVLCLLILFIQPYEKSLGWDNVAASELFSFGVGLSLTSILNYGAKQGDNFVIARWLGSTALGVYGRAYALMAAPVTVAGQVMDRVLFASVSRVQTDTAKMRRAFMSVTTVVALLTVPLSVICFLAAPEIIAVLLGPGWQEATTPFQILVLGMFFRVAYKVGGSVSRGVGVVYKMAWRQGVYALAIIGGGLIGQRWGLSGVAIAVLLGVTGNYILSTELALTLIEEGWLQVASILGRSLLLSFVAGAPSWLVGEITRDMNASPIVTLTCMLSASLLFYVAMLRFRSSWFVDGYTADIMHDLFERLPGGARAVKLVLPLGTDPAGQPGRNG